MKIRTVELLANIRTNLVAFVSIAMFVCMGIGLFLGIQWGAFALRNATHEVFEDGNMHDIEVQFPYGITESDLKELRAVEGVSDIEYGYSCYVTMRDGNMSHILKFQSMTEDIDQPTSVVGNLPMEPDEVALLDFWADEQGIGIGDRVELKHDGTSGDDDGMEYLKSDTFTVTALVQNPAYVSRLNGTLGVSNMGSGSVDCVGFVTSSAFDESKFEGAYSNVYVRCDVARGKNTFFDDYKQAMSPIVDEVTELGGELGTAQYEKVHHKAQDSIDNAQQQVDDGQKQLDEGKKKIQESEKLLDEGKQQLDDGEKKLLDGVVDGSYEQSIAQQKLYDAYRQLSDGQARYDAGVDEYNAASDLYNQVNAKFQSIHVAYDALVDLYYELRAIQPTFDSVVGALEGAIDAYDKDATDENWTAVEQAYDDVSSIYDTSLVPNIASIEPLLDSVGNVMGIGLPVGSLSDLGILSRGSHGEALARAKGIAGELSHLLDVIANESLVVDGITITVLDIPGGLQLVHDQLVDSKAQLDAARIQLDEGWNEYYSAKSQYDVGVAEGQESLRKSEKDIEDGKQSLSQKEKELEDGKQTLSQKEKELQDGKDKLEEAKERFSKLEEYEWVVMPRRDNGGVQAVELAAGMMDNVRWAMALLFILVGLFVCYSAISRLVHDQSVQIGTKKALGFHKGQIARGYLWFSGLSVLLGTILSIFVAVIVVQGIMNPTAARQYTVPPYDPYVNVLDVVAMGAIELALILASTWIAISGLVKRQAIDLLRGESTGNAKVRFYERTKLWGRMSLFSQTVVNNCANDPRRVVGTLIGVIGCTALIVVAVTLRGNIARSLELHYQSVYSFDAIAYLNEPGDESARQVAMELYDHGVASAPVFMRKVQIRGDDGTRSLATLVVPTNEDSFKKFYHVEPVDGGGGDVEAGHLWMNAAYGEHTGVKAGEKVTLTEGTGKTHEFVVADYFKYYLIRQEFVLSQNEYREAFGVKPAPNALLVNTDGASISRLRDSLLEVDGYDSLVEDRELASYGYKEISNILNIVVLIYLVLSALMAVIVLLNLDSMFVDEKKRELIVLMICGFSTREAKAYIYRDSVVLTVIGIALGILLGAVMGGITVWALEPSTGYFVKGFNEIAAIVGALGAGLFAVAVLVYSLRRIPRFDLTDINRF